MINYNGMKFKKCSAVMSRLMDKRMTYNLVEYVFVFYIYI